MRSSIAKMPLEAEQQPIRSIFPTYNPDLPPDRQEYIPTQMSPSHIPRAVISRQGIRPDEDEEDDEEIRPASRMRSPVQRWGGPSLDAAPRVPAPCTIDQLKSLWKVTNGWKASGSEGRVYCLKLGQERDAPVYTLASAAGEAFYHMRLDPTSASANVTVAKHDPSKPYKTPSASDVSVKCGVDGWQEALGTTLEEPSRHHRPNDGLVALLMPTAAARAAVARAEDAQAVFMAEREAARLVWDDDSATHFLVHPALARPFQVTVDRSPAWSRVEYVLEHHESPRHLAKLTRDGTGGGWLEVDTGIASKIESFYIVDVAITALMLVMAADDRSGANGAVTTAAPMETFEPPPPVVLKSKPSGGFLGVKGKPKTKPKPKMEEFEIDVESQEGSSLKKGKGKASAVDKLPFVARVVVKTARGLFKCFLWALTVVWKCFALVFRALNRCVGSKY